MTERMRNQVLRSLVDEKLQLQEARRVEIKIEDTEINERIEALAKESQMSLEGIEDFLEENNVETDALKSQIHAELAWNRFVRRSFSGRVKVGEQEIDEQYNKAVRAVNQTRYQVSEILLNMDAFADERQIQQISGEIVRQLQSGVDFGAVARQFSHRSDSGPRRPPWLGDAGSARHAGRRRAANAAGAGVQHRSQGNAVTFWHSSTNDWAAAGRAKRFDILSVVFRTAPPPAPSTNSPPISKPAAAPSNRPKRRKPKYGAPLRQLRQLPPQLARLVNVRKPGS